MLSSPPSSPWQKLLFRKPRTQSKGFDACSTRFRTFLPRAASFLLLLLAVILLLEPSAWAQGCAICRAALANSPEGRVLAGSFRRGILVLMAAPFGIFGTIGYALFRAYRRKKRGM